MLFTGIDWSDSRRAGTGLSAAHGRRASLGRGNSSSQPRRSCHTLRKIGWACPARSNRHRHRNLPRRLDAVAARSRVSYLPRESQVGRFVPQSPLGQRQQVRRHRSQGPGPGAPGFLVTFHQDLRPLQPDDPEIITLRIACEDRVRLVRERTAKLCELEALLKIYYPVFVGFFGDFDSRITLEFLQQFPTQTQMQGLTPGRLRGWLKRHAYTCGGRIEAMTATLKKPALPVPQHLQQAKGTLIRYLATSLIALKAEITRRDGEIDDRFGQMPEADWIRTLPGTGPTLAPALLACLGRDRQRFATTEDARAFMGTAPVTFASGSSRVVRFRRGCWKFARRTLSRRAGIR